MGAWRYRVAKDDKNKLHFVSARYDDVDEYARRGMIPTIAFNEADTVDELRRLARSLLRACDEPVISMAEIEDEPDGGDGEDDEDSCDSGHDD